MDKKEITNNISAIILAAGKGTRMGTEAGSEIPKVMFRVNGKPLVEYAINNIRAVGVDDIILVVGYKKEIVEEYFKNSVRYVEQREQLGTGHATMQARPLLEGKERGIIVTYGDMPLYKSTTINKLVEEFNQKKPALAMVTVNFSDPEFWAYGRIIRDKNGKVIANVEQKDCNNKELKITECNPSFYLFDNSFLWNNFEKLSTNNAQGEYYLTDMIKLAADAGKEIVTVEASEDEVMGVNTPEQLKVAEKILEEQKVNKKN